MDRRLAYPATTTSCFIGATSLTNLNKVEDPEDFLVFVDGLPAAHPSMPRGRVLVAQLMLAPGQQPAWVCNNVQTMRELTGLVGTDGVLALKWFTGDYSLIDVQPLEVTVVWNAGWNKYLVELTSRRDMTPDEIAQTTGNGQYSPVVVADDKSEWLRCSFAGPLFGPLGETQVVRILERLGSGD